MPEITRPNGDSDRFELGFVAREATPEFAMRFGIRLYFTIL